VLPLCLCSLPDWSESSAHRGRKEGMVQMFRKNGVAIAAQWSAASGTWIEVGEVTGTSNAGVIDGKPALADPRSLPS
jgi:phospholipase A-2-activating protein